MTVLTIGRRMADTPHICFVAPLAWPVLSRDTRIKSVGGAEVQQSILARAFAQRGYRVTMICLDYGQPDGIEIDGMRVLKACTPDAGIPIVRFVHPRFTSIWKAMWRADADIYYQRGSGVLTGYTAAFCRHYGRRFVFAAASDADLYPDAPLLRYRRDKWLYKTGLCRAHAIVVQHETQRDLYRERFQAEPTLIRSCYAPPATAQADARGYVLWVATIREWKRPTLLLDLAARLPQVKFRMIGGSDDPRYYAKIVARAHTLGNVDFIGFVPHAEIEPHFDGARLFVNTSEGNEGFPNTFLQAWARGIPTISFVNPAPDLNDGPIPLCARNMSEMLGLIEVLTQDDKLWHDAGVRVRTRFLDHHSLESVVASYDALFDRLSAFRVAGCEGA